MSITPCKRENLEKLATYLEGLPVDYGHFDMGSYAEHKGCDEFDERSFEKAFHDSSVQTLEHCGTSACAVGHGPAAGISFAKSDLRKYAPGGYSLNWSRYTDRNFVEESEDAWDWMFAGTWDAVDNHHYGAAARIRYFLDKGVPAAFWLGSFDTPAEKWLDLYAPYRVDAKPLATQPTA